MEKQKTMQYEVYKFTDSNILLQTTDGIKEYFRPPYIPTQKKSNYSFDSSGKILYVVGCLMILFILRDFIFAVK